MGTSQFNEAHSDTLPKSGKEIKIAFDIHLPAFPKVQPHTHFLSSYYMPGSIFWGLRGKCYAVSILVSKTVSSRRQDRENTLKMIEKGQNEGDVRDHE